MTNKERILNYLIEHGKATIREFVVELWIQTPQEYIRQLRNEGHKIDLIKEHPKDKHGTYIYKQEQLVLL